MIDRRQFLAMASATMTAPLFAKAATSSVPQDGSFPDKFFWGAASAGHQVEGNNVNSDIWLLENVKPTLFKEQSGDACNSFELWETDLELCRSLGFSAYRFSIEWARIEPEPGLFSQAMIDHYKRIIDGCHKRNMIPLVTFNHFASPVWFGARGGWINPEAPALFANYCSKVASQVADSIGYAVTFNEPNLLRLLKVIGIPPFVWDMQEKMLAAAGKASQSDYFCAINAARLSDLDVMNSLLIEGHIAARQAIKAERTNLDVGFTLAMLDDQSEGPDSVRDDMRQYNYGDWLNVTETDFIGVQNYEKVIWNDKGRVHTPEDAEKNNAGSWIDATSLANTVAYTYAETGKPIIVSEHGIGTNDDSQRERFIKHSLKHLQRLIEDGVPVKGYIHWTLLDNFEWISGYSEHFGLHTVDRKTFERKPKPSALAYSKIIKQNRV
ncbi:glycoside hydrolase family 1 protein [Alteromonas gilva]|uniref:Family 1 glycosylhydrolase n=1 Tax=Alteromonas gilva TaxID=2987522 RepID=A0ABT5L7P8_9ALTE|nr:family 1 glycosylhydrolase [Alteromonas gilva]MDC8833055.1 family 1 glycosylhydrolase [Alteromonas gilva]